MNKIILYNNDSQKLSSYEYLSPKHVNKYLLRLELQVSIILVTDKSKYSK